MEILIKETDTTMTTVYLHIGAPKTGTTSLQFFLYNNRSLLRELGICYPALGFHFEGVHESRNANFLIRKIWGPDGNHCTGQEKSIRDEGLARLKPLIGQYPVILLSEESIWNDRRMNTEAFLALRSALEAMGARLKVIAYVRRQDLVMPSYWAQLVKNRMTMTFDEFISSREFKRYRLYYDRRLDEINAAIGMENILVRPFEKRQFEGRENTLFSDFLYLFGLTPDERFSLAQPVRNSSLQKKLLELKRIFNRNPAFCEKKSFVVPLLEQWQDSHPLIGSEQYFTPEEQVEFLKTFDTGNRTVATRYLKRTNGILFYDRPTDSSSHTAYTGAGPAAAVSPATVPAEQPEELLSICSDLLLLQNARIEKLEAELRASRNNSLKKRCARKIRRIIPVSFRPQKS